MTDTPFHIPVLLNESINNLDIADNDIVVDATFGGGGHSREIIKRFGLKIRLICVDLDEKAQIRFDNLFANSPNIKFVQANFKDVDQILEKSQVSQVNKVLLDLGTSTFQLLEDNRGFSFKSASPLLMSFSEKGSHTGISAYDIVNSWQEQNIADIIYAYGQERNSRKIAHQIVAARANGPITDSSTLADIISGAFSFRGRLHPATTTFQALRITVNDELNVLKEALDNWWQVLAPGGRIAVITFHSLEDKIVKQWMKNQINKRVITKKPLIASKTELLTNPRARSAKLRTIEKQ